MKFNIIETKEILDFEKEIGHELVVNERAINHLSPKSLPRYYVHFENASLTNGCTVFEMTGEGNTIDEAIKDYCRQVSNCKVVFKDNTKFREEIRFPKLIHTTLLG